MPRRKTIKVSSSLKELASLGGSSKKRASINRRRKYRKRK